MTNSDLSELGFKQLPNYSTHAIEFFDGLAIELPRRLGLRADLEELISELLKGAVKFLLPDNGYLFAEHDYKPSMFDLLKLPYPVCALEFHATTELYTEGSGLVHAAKRIALCFDPRQLSDGQTARLSRLCEEPFERGLPEHCLAVMSVYEANGIWGCGVGVVLIDLEEDRPYSLKSRTPGELDELGMRLGAKLNKKSTAHGLPATFRSFPARSRVVGQSPDEAIQCLYLDTLDEMRVSYEFLAAINCSNVGTQDVAAPRALNEKRTKKGKTPFYPYKVLDLAADSVARCLGVGTHASPRSHLRRGHLRRLGERFGNKVLWINATVVKSSAESSTELSTVYKVRGAPSSRE